MFERIIRFAIEQRWLVLLAVLGMAGLGVYNYQKLPIDAVPDITNVQVQINTGAPGYSPLETEQRVTFPIETVMAGLPGLLQTRLQFGCCQGIGDHGEARAMDDAKRLQLGQATEGGQGECLVTRWMASDDIESAQADRTGSTQNGDLLNLAHNTPQPASHSNMANTGTAAVRLSMRSSTPP